MKTILRGLVDLSVKKPVVTRTQALFTEKWAIKWMDHIKNDAYYY